MAKLQNKLHAKFEVIEKEIVPNILKKMKDCEKTLDSLSVFSRHLFERLISSSNQQEFFFGPFSSLDHINNILVLCIFRTEAENLITVKKSEDSESESKGESLLMMEARKRLGEVLQYLETLHSLVVMLREESVKIMEFVSSSRLESGGHQEVMQKLSDYEKKLNKFSSIALNLDSYLSMASVPESRYPTTEREHFPSTSQTHVVTAALSARPEQSKLSEVGEEDEVPEKPDLCENQHSETESSIPSFSPPHPSDESEAGDDTRPYRYEAEKGGMIEEVRDRLCEASLTEK